MGMYTELVLAVDLIASIPKDALAILKYASDGGASPELPGWYRFGHRSYYFDGQPYAALSAFDDISKTWHFQCRFNCKNCSSDIEAFCDWISPWVEETDGMAGYTRYEEDSVPTLIYFIEGKCVRIEPPEPFLRLVDHALSGGCHS